MEEGDGMREQVSVFRGSAPGKESGPRGPGLRAVPGLNSFCLQFSVGFGNPYFLEPL